MDFQQTVFVDPTVPNTSQDLSKNENTEEEQKKDRIENPTNEFGDNMESYLWDGPDDSDEEIPEMVELMNE